MSAIAAAIGLGAVGSVAGAVISGNAAKDAANTQAAAARDANAVQWDMYQQQRTDQEPWRQAGVKALGQMESPDFQKTFSLNDFQQDPGYQFRLAEGTKALNAAAAARGMANSGATMKALSNYNQNFASNEYQNAYNRFNNDASTRFNRLSALAGVGQTANNQLASAGSNYANAAGNNMMGAANASSAATMAGANATNQAISGFGNSLMQYNMMNKMFPSGGGGAAVPATSAGGSYTNFGLIA